MNIIILSGPQGCGKSVLLTGMSKIGFPGLLENSSSTIIWYEDWSVITLLGKLTKGRKPRTVVFEDLTNIKSIIDLLSIGSVNLASLIIVTQRSDLLPQLCMALPGHRITELKMSYGQIEINPSRVAEAHVAFDQQFNKE